MRVLSWQCSGVAWVPWRIEQVLRGSSVVEYRATAAYQGLESYGLPEVSVEHDLLTAAVRADVVHLHHAYAAEEMIPLLRAHLPEVKILVTLHGEPDRSRGRGCANRPDAYHVVEPGLLKLCGDVPAFFVPNHPARDLPRAEACPRARRLLVPFSHVAQWKDMDQLEATTPELQAAGWRVDRMPARVTNDELLIEVARSAAVWVQRRGYLDLLTMECWSLGALPVVGVPSINDCAPWVVALDFFPLLVGGMVSGPEVASSLIGWDGVATLRENRSGMADHWTVERCRSRWEELFESIFG